MLTQEIANQILAYDPESGEFRYKVSTNGRNKQGAIAGSPTLGYLSIMFKGRNYRLHRVVFLLEDGVFPKDQVDHINGVRDDNRRSNLRKATNQQNSWNKSSEGVLYQKNGVNKFSPYTDHMGKRTYYGSFFTREEAANISLMKRNELRGEYARK
jgi:hypothetical protein